MWNLRINLKDVKKDCRSLPNNKQVCQQILEWVHSINLLCPTHRFGNTSFSKLWTLYLYFFLLNQTFNGKSLLKSRNKFVYVKILMSIYVSFMKNSKIQFPRILAQIFPFWGCYIYSYFDAAKFFNEQQASLSYSA